MIGTLSRVRSFRVFAALCMATALFIAACGGGGSSSSAAPQAMASGNTITGVVASGHPLRGFVYIKDATGMEVNIPISANGTYSADVSGMMGPFIVRAIPNIGPKLYSSAPIVIAANVSQLTTLSLYLANGMGDLETLYRDWPTRHASFTGDIMIHAQAVVNANFNQSFTQNGLDYTTFNIFTAPFTANGTGFDAVLDWVGTILFRNGQIQFSGNPSIQFDPNIDVSNVNVGSLSAGFVLTETLIPPPVVIIVPPSP